MKKVVPYLYNLYDRWRNKRLIRLLALLLALAVATPVLLAEDGDHDHDNDKDQGRFVDPIVGSWIVHVHVTTFSPTPNPPPPFDFDDLTVFWEEGGITLSSDPTSGTGYGVWKKVAPRTHVTKFLTVDPPALGLPQGTINTLFGGPMILNPQGTEMKGSFHGFDTDPTGKVIDQFSGTAVIDRINFTSNP
jgi:hypothetical protein